MDEQIERVDCPNEQCANDFIESQLGEDGSVEYCASCGEEIPDDLIEDDEDGLETALLVIGGIAIVLAWIGYEVSQFLPYIVA